MFLALCSQQPIRGDFFLHRDVFVQIASCKWFATDTCYCDWKQNALRGLNQHLAAAHLQSLSFQCEHGVIHHCVPLQWPNMFHRQLMKLFPVLSCVLEGKKKWRTVLELPQNIFGSRSGQCKPLSLLSCQSKSVTSVWSLTSLLRGESSCSELTGSAGRPALLPVPT